MYTTEEKYTNFKCLIKEFDTFLIPWSMKGYHLSADFESELM